jgi:hypothetical protein
MNRGLVLSLFVFSSVIFSECLNSPARSQVTWSGYAGNSQHTALSTVGSQPLDRIVWQTAVDQNPQFSGNDLLIHYGSPAITSANTVIIPVKTGAADGFEIEARRGLDGSLLWTQPTDYSLPAHGWTPSYGPTITPQGRVYYAGAGGTVYFRDNLNTAGSVTPTQVAFFGDSLYKNNKSAFNAGVEINTPLTSDSAGNVYFGYQVSGATPNSLQSGIARIDSAGNGSFVTVGTATAGNAAKVVTNCAPALSNDGKTLYVAMSQGNFGAGYLVALDSATLASKASVLLKDPRSGGANPALLPDDGTASPTVAPDGRVFFGVLENPFGTSKGWLQQFNADLTQTPGKAPGGFGWDDTVSIVPRSMAPGYIGSSPYLLMTKYNNYGGTGGDGKNRIAILDPNDTQIDPRTGVTVMKEVMSILGPTPDDDFPGLPDAVREWCINTAVVDPPTDSILANSEDGKLYRWNLATNTFSEEIVLTPGIGEAYTPTLIGADGKVYAINNATLFAVGALSVAEPSSAAWLMALFLIMVALLRRGSRRDVE